MLPPLDFNLRKAPADKTVGGATPLDTYRSAGADFCTGGIA
jgi:hypothetical protein